MYLCVNCMPYWALTKGFIHLRTSMGSLHAQIFYVPLSVVIPPSVYMVHRQFNLIYQFWIHTEVVDRLGPLEWILNTPSHHRVHHGGSHFT